LPMPPCASRDGRGGVLLGLPAECRVSLAIILETAVDRFIRYLNLEKAVGQESTG